MNYCIQSLALWHFHCYLRNVGRYTWSRAILHLNWFTKSYWQYLLEKKSPDYSWWEVIICRMRAHPAGVFWYNANGFEPDMTCRGCGDDLG